MSGTWFSDQSSQRSHIYPIFVTKKSKEKTPNVKEKREDAFRGLVHLCSSIHPFLSLPGTSKCGTHVSWINSMNLIILIIMIMIMIIIIIIIMIILFIIILLLTMLSALTDQSWWRAASPWTAPPLPRSSSSSSSLSSSSSSSSWSSSPSSSSWSSWSLSSSWFFTMSG